MYCYNVIMILNVLLLHITFYLSARLFVKDFYSIWIDL